MSFEDNFLQLTEEVPPVYLPPPGQKYRYWKRAGSLIVLSGHGPRWGTEFRYKGKVGREISLEQAYVAARLTTLNLLQTLRQALGSLNQVDEIVEVFAAVNSAPGFTEQSKVLNGCSDCLVAIFGERGMHTRMAVGVAELPFNIAVEIKMTVQVAIHS
jgi:enamine deaminase RidA (YjgF/YER057c/UK114 family)